MTDNISKKLSCGVLVIDSNDRLLMLHVTGQSFWDIPKGTQEEYEQPIATAVREMEEESGIVANEEDLIEIGWCEYNRYKDLWLFILPVESIDLEKLNCKSTFTDHDDFCIEKPEIDDYKMVSFEDAEQFMCGSLQRLYNNELRNDIERVNKTQNRKKIIYR